MAYSFCAGVAVTRPCAFFVRAHLATGALGLARRNVVAVAGVVACGQQEVPPAVVAAAEGVAGHQGPVKLRVEKMAIVLQIPVTAFEYQLIRLDHAGRFLSVVHDIRKRKQPAFL